MKKVIISTAILSLLSSPVFATQLTPNKVLDLACWKTTLPIDVTGSGKASDIDAVQIAEGYAHSEYFYVNKAGDGVVFSSPIEGVLTSKNTTYVRSELREMGRCSDTRISTKGINGNNWVFSSAPEAEHAKASGVDGTMDAVLSVDEVTTTGEIWQQGRVIVGQIHANNDEPVKLFYRKMPNHDLGSVWVVHETNGGDETTYPLVGTNVPGYWTQDEPVVEPTDGIKLGEKWGYQIKVVGNELSVTLRRDDKDDVVQVIDMTNSKYDVGGQYMYFKAGVYNQNKSGKPDERATATFYDLKVTHD